MHSDNKAHCRDAAYPHHYICHHPITAASRVNYRKEGCLESCVRGRETNGSGFARLV